MIELERLAETRYHAGDEIMVAGSIGTVLGAVIVNPLTERPSMTNPQVRRAGHPVDRFEISEVRRTVLGIHNRPV